MSNLLRRLGICYESSTADRCYSMVRMPVENARLGFLLNSVEENFDVLDNDNRLRGRRSPHCISDAMTGRSLKLVRALGDK